MLKINLLAIPLGLPYTILGYASTQLKHSKDKKLNTHIQ